MKARYGPRHDQLPHRSAFILFVRSPLALRTAVHANPSLDVNIPTNTEHSGKKKNGSAALLDERLRASRDHTTTIH